MDQNESQNKISMVTTKSITFCSCGILVSLLGIIFLFGWLTHTTTLIQIQSDFTPIKFNEALELFVMGLGMISYFKMPRVSILFGLIAFLIGSLTLAEYMFSINIGIDQLFSNPYLDTNTSYPGRMAPNTALYFLLGGILLFFRKPLVKFNNLYHLNFVLSGFLAFTGLSGIIGYMTTFSIAYEWGNWAQMSIQSAVGIMIIGLGFSNYFYNIKDKKYSTLADNVIILGALLFIFLWQALTKNEYQKISEDTRSQAAIAEKLIIQNLKARDEYVGALIDVNKLMSSIFLQLSSFKNYGIELKNGNQIIYQQNNYRDKFEKNWNFILPINFKNIQWELKIWPNEAQIKRSESWFPVISLFTGLLVTFLLSVVIRVLQTVNEKKIDLENSESKLIDKSHSIQVVLDVMNAIANEENFEKGMQHCLTIICISYRWQVGHIYLIDSNNSDKLFPSTIWFFSEKNKYYDFYNETMNTTLNYGIGLPGRVLASGLPVWIEDISKDGNFTRVEVCKSSNLNSALAFPIKVNTKIIGIFEIFSSASIIHDANFLQVINILSNQISRFLEFHRIADQNKNLAERFKFAVGAGKIGVWEWDLKTNKLIWDEQMFNLYGVDPANFKGGYEDWENALHPDDRKEAVEALYQAAQNYQPFDQEFRIIKPGGKIRSIKAKAKIIFSNEGQPKAFLGLNWDITKEKELTAKLTTLNQTLEHYAYYDSLTGLMNRHAFEDAATRLLAQARRHNYLLGVLFVDLDYFKKINDTLGHKVGDQVLIETAKRLVLCLHSEDIVCRLGGDEFVVILSDIKNKSNCEMIADKVINKIKQVYKINNHEIHVGASVGISFYPGSGEDLTELLDQADKALLTAKNEGRGKSKIHH